MTSIYRKTVWYLRGRSQYTKSGFLKAAASFAAGDLDVNAAGRGFMVTGANSGIGKACAMAYAKAGGHVYLVCRNRDRAIAAQAEIESATGNKNVEVFELDMADSKAVKAFATEFIASKRPLDVLVNNAGCMIHNKQTTAIDLEYNFSINLFSGWLLTRLLLPTLQSSPTGRVIMMSSGGMLLEKMDVNDFQLSKRSKFSAVDSYSQQKRQQVELAEHWAKTVEGVEFYSTHPGWADTPAFREALPDFYNKMKDEVRTAEQGADTAIWLGLVSTVDPDLNGQFVQDRVAVSKHLPLAWTSSSDEDRAAFEAALEHIAKQHELL
eukprot:m.131172 g.131172  ORF g.131172 m.131172 type:complete len:323 (-) comp15902_c0_seq3:1678-2646(-)